MKPWRIDSHRGEFISDSAKAHAAVPGAGTGELQHRELAAATARAGVDRDGVYAGDRTRTMRSDDVITSAFQWVSRGQTFPALCREIAWTAARSTGTERDNLDWLLLVVDRQLGERMDDLPMVVRRASLEAQRKYLCTRPHDSDGAEMVADLAVRDAAVEYLTTAYMDALDWAVGVLQDRLVKAGRGRWWQRSSRRQAVDEPVQCEVARRILDGLTWRSTQPGWNDQRAA